MSERDKIFIEIDGGEEIIIRAYNHQIIEEYVEERNRFYKGLYSDDENKVEYIAEATNLEREWIEALGQNIPLPKGKKIFIFISPGHGDYYLQDEDFNKLSNRLNQLIDSYMIEEEKSNE